ncbi:MAG: baseplate multidomain protein megatron, partial [Bosea sp. (in: a-proteobacteria)]
CPNLGTIQIITSWFGDDLRAGSCAIAPRVDNAIKLTDGATWGVAGLARATARLVTQIDGRPIYGGTPSDASLLALIAEIKRRRLKVVLYPFIMMDVGPGNVLPNPYGGTGQPALPWRGRITCAPAPGLAGTVDATAAAATQIGAFVGTVVPADLTLNGQQVICAKPNEWSFRRHILHYARLAVAAGGVDGFVIGSEMVALSRVRSASGVYPFVSALQAIAVDARAMLGSTTRITYAADWTEYGAHVLAGGQEVRFPLDPLWASSAISAVGIDYYAPISDWRDGADHLDATIARSHHDADYLATRQTSGEAFDWFYASDAARRSQTRTPISDGTVGKPWVFRTKDMASWWLNPHRERVAGVEIGSNTAWVPGSKPIWLTEVGCPAVDKGANAPNVFPDPKSSENALPFFSSGERDDLAQVRALKAQLGVFDPASPRFRAIANPLNSAGTLRMMNPADTAIWAWDARPFPAFPMLASVWSDGANWSTGHWLNGRLEAAPLDRLVAGILADFGLQGALRLDIDQMVDGYVIDRPMSARAALEPLARLFALDASFDQGRLVLRGQSGRMAVAISADQLVPERDGKPFELRRAQETELPRELRIGFIDGNWDYRSAASRSRRLAGSARREVALDAAIVTSRADGDRLAEQRLKEAWVGRETLSFRLSPRQLSLEPGDACTFDIDGQARLFRITEIADGEVRRVTSVSAERHPANTPIRPEAAPRITPAPALAGKPFAVVLELPVQRGPESVLQYLAAYASPWPGSLDVLRQSDGASFDPFTNVSQPALVGRLVSGLAAGPLWRWDRSASVDIEIEAGALQSVSDMSALGGANTFAVLGPDGLWEILSAASVALIAPRRYRLSRLVRGLGGSEPAALRAVSGGALIVGVDEALVPLGSGLSDLGRSFKLRVVPSGLDAADPAVITLDVAPTGLPLRPLSPVHVRARRSAAGVTITWIRRTRTDGDNWQQTEPPLGEMTERYQLQFFAGAVMTRQVETSMPSFLYTPAFEVADHGGPQASLDIAAAQISESVGAGAVRRGVIRVG